MNYEYTSINRLNFPHKYTYTQYYGAKFISAYFRDRLRILARLQLCSEQSCNRKIDEHLYIELENQLKKYLDRVDNPWKDMVDKNTCLNFKKKPRNLIKYKIGQLNFYNIESEINTESLLLSLLFSQINNQAIDPMEKVLVDLIVKKFEVTKKIHTVYLPNFKIGKYGVNKIYLYWMFALLLSLYYIKMKNLKYLNTLLKVSDLLYSLDFSELLREVPKNGISLVLLVEMLSIKLLSDNTKEDDFASK